MSRTDRWSARIALLGVALLALSACQLSGSRTTLPAVEARSDAARAPGRVRIATYNTWLLPVASMELGTRREQMPQALAALDLDILCLQEVWQASDRESLAAALAPHFPHAAASTGGLLILSRWPVVSRAFEKLPAGAGLGLVEQIAGKGILEAVVRTPTGTLRILNTHLALANGPVAKAAWREQLDHLLAYAAGRREIPVVIAGDLNIRTVDNLKPSPAYRLLTEQYKLNDADPHRVSPEGHLAERDHTRVGWPRNSGLLYHWAPDVILYWGAPHLGVSRIGSGRALETPTTALSDHNLVWAELQLHPRASAR